MYATINSKTVPTPLVYSVFDSLKGFICYDRLNFK